MAPTQDPGARPGSGRGGSARRAARKQAVNRRISAAHRAGRFSSLQGATSPLALLVCLRCKQGCRLAIYAGVKRTTSATAHNATEILPNTRSDIASSSLRQLVPIGARRMAPSLLAVWERPRWLHNQERARRQWRNDDGLGRLGCSPSSRARGTSAPRGLSRSVAEREGFEPSVPLQGRRFSSLGPLVCAKSAAKKHGDRCYSQRPIETENIDVSEPMAMEWQWPGPRRPRRCHDPVMANSSRAQHLAPMG